MTLTDEQIKLEPCPFCGADGKLIDTMGLWEKGRYGPRGCRVVCIGKDCSGMGEVSHGENRVSEAVNSWNRRYTPPGEAVAEKRFYLDHGVIHDRVTGKHVVTNGQWPYEDTVEMVCDLLNSLSAPPSPSVPDGYVVVPREPTPEMLAAAVEAKAEWDGVAQTWVRGSNDDYLPVWEAMITASDKETGR